MAVEGQRKGSETAVEGHGKQWKVNGRQCKVRERQCYDALGRGEELQRGSRHRPARHSLYNFDHCGLLPSRVGQHAAIGTAAERSATTRLNGLAGSDLETAVASWPSASDELLSSCTRWRVLLSCTRAGWVSMLLSEWLRQQRNHPAQGCTSFTSSKATSTSPSSWSTHCVNLS